MFQANVIGGWKENDNMLGQAELDPKGDMIGQGNCSVKLFLDF